MLYSSRNSYPIQITATNNACFRWILVTVFLFDLRGGKIMQASINTAVFANEIQDGGSQISFLEKLSDYPIDNIEVRGELFNEETKDSELKQIEKLCQKNNWGFFYSIPEQLFKTNEVNSNIEDYLKMAEKYHIGHLKISLGDLSEIITDQLDELKELISKYDVKVTIENEPNDNGILSNITQQLIKLRELDIPLGYTFDSGNWYWIYEDPIDAFKNVSDAITVFHLKDIKDKETVMLNEGATDWKSLLNNLATNIPVFIEYETSEKELPGQIKLVNDVLKKRDSK